MAYGASSASNEEYLARAYDDTRRSMTQHSFRDDDDLPADD